MRSPFKVLQDWNQVKVVKKTILAQLKAVRPGACISISGGLNDEIMARAIIEILHEHGTDIEMMDHGFSVSLMRKVDMHQSMTADTYSGLRARHEILTLDTIKEFDLKGKKQLPQRKYRDGVPDNVNDAGPVTQQAKLILP